MEGDDRRGLCAGCGAEIFWRWTERGKPIPLNSEPHGEVVPGTFVIQSADSCRRAVPLFDTDVPVYMNHFATCPKGKEFSGKGKTR